MEIKKTLLEKYEKNFDLNKQNKLAMNAVTNNGVNKSAQNYQAVRNIPHEFSLIIPQKGITHQKNTGRCWLFAATNCLRFHVMKKYNLEEFELSQNFLLFYDKLEKANFFFENILETLDEPTDGRLISFLLSGPENDGGQWDMFCNIVNKYGLLPKTAMPETIPSSATEEMQDYLTEKLRQCACIIRKKYQKGATVDELRKEKECMMEDIYRILCICLGKPPQKFDFELRTKNDKYIVSHGITPKEFYEKYISIDLNDYVSLINAPTKDKPYNRSYTVKFLGNVKEGKSVRYLNLSIEELKKLAIAQLKDKNPVWFGCDVGKSKIRESGIMDLGAYDIEELFSTDFYMTKAERLDYGQSLMTHAMVFQGVNLDHSEKPNRWRVENSWGDEIGKKGYFVMTDAWFDEYMYQVVVNKKYLTDEQIMQYQGEPIELEPWDPMGSLALSR